MKYTARRRAPKTLSRSFDCSSFLLDPWHVSYSHYPTATVLSHVTQDCLCCSVIRMHANIKTTRYCAFSFRHIKGILIALSLTLWASYNCQVIAAITAMKGLISFSLYVFSVDSFHIFPFFCSSHPSCIGSYPIARSLVLT